MQKVKHALAEAAQKRADNWQPRFVRKLPDPEGLDEIAMLGAHSYALIQTRRRLIKDRLEIEPDIYETPSAIARDYLRLIYKRGPRGTTRQLEIVEGIQPVPSIAIPGRFAHGLYIDIQSCYWSIMKIAGWDVDYNPGLWLLPGRPPSDFPFSEHKVARNCLVSAGRMTGIPMYDPRRKPNDPFMTVTRGNELKNNQLPRLIHDILNSIAMACFKEGAIYHNNDGLIAPTPNIAARCAQIINDWGLTSRIKAEGSGEVQASGTYRIGSARTLTYQGTRDPLPIKNVYPPPYTRWLQREFSELAGGAK
jgi:hypothetical protein